MPTKKTPARDPKPVIESMLRQLKQAEDQVRNVLDLFAELPKGSKNATERFDKLVLAMNQLALTGSHLPRDWEKSTWFIDEEHMAFLHALENELKLTTLNQKQKL